MLLHRAESDGKIRVDVKKLMHVTIELGVDETEEYVATFCGYGTAKDVNGGLCVAIHILYDPMNQKPSADYYCYPDAIKNVVFPPHMLKKVRVYDGWKDDE